MSDIKALTIWNGVLLVGLLVLAVQFNQVKADNVAITNNYNQAVEQTAEETAAFNADYVYTMCNESRVYDTVTEEMCVELQDYYSVDFKCVINNKEINNTCWVEEI